MSLNRPQRVPITHQEWLRYFAELEARTGDSDNDLIAQTRQTLAATEGTTATLTAAVAGIRGVLQRLTDRLRALEMRREPNDATARTALKQIAQQRFLGDFGWH